MCVQCYKVGTLEQWSVHRTTPSANHFSCGGRGRTCFTDVMLYAIDGIHQKLKIGRIEKPKLKVFVLLGRVFYYPNCINVCTPCCRPLHALYLKSNLILLKFTLLI